jgi:hypothetical protein
MKTEHFSVRLGPTLPVVLQELTTKLNADDWTRHSTGDDAAFYYILGMKAWTADQQGEANFETLSVPIPQAVSPMREYQVHAQVAGMKSSEYYVRQARSRLESCGVDPNLVNKFVEFKFVDGVGGADLDDLSLIVGRIIAVGNGSLAALADLLQVLVMAKGIEPNESSTEDEKRRELNAAVQKVYLLELSRVYKSVVHRAASLEALSFPDPQLNEASRCYLYGFFRGAAILSASALETSFREAIGPTALDQVQRVLATDDSRRKRGFFNLLVDEAASRGLLGERVRVGEEPALVAYSRRIFKDRNKIAHEGYNPPADVTLEILTSARQVIEFVRERIP